jgi:predicted DNA-binding transcriptional regulator AlpA
MSDYHFSLILSGETEGKLDGLFEAGCDDATFGSVDGTAYAEFDREGASLALAIGSAIHDVESVSGIRVVHVEPDPLVTASDIAERLGRSRESVRLLISGERGNGNFPSPISHLRTRNRLWRWSDVAAWAGLADFDTLQDAQLIAAVNAALDLRSTRPSLPNEGRKLVASIGRHVT